ncbi:MAG TPA: polyprenyl synthetase family protein [Thermoanaerobacterales bacterium]|nr:polyprenyl synthetase family protein [Thermoanaerobacterales bacterium]
MNLRQYLSERKAIIDESLDKLLPYDSEYPNIIHKSIRYSIFSGGKRIRPILVMASAETVGGSFQDVIPIACGVELIHTYSLIHDDLPALDNDNYRRGKLTNHKVFGEEIAILAGDALLTMAFEIISNEQNKVNSHKILQIINELARSCGTKGMIGGQVVDLESEGKQINISTLEYIHINKTAALINASIRAGAIYFDASEEQLNMLTKYAEKLGLLFQITDDLLDLEGDIKKIGKPVGSDIKNKKATYPRLCGIDKTYSIAHKLADEAKEIAGSFGEKGTFFNLLPDYLLTREF